MTTWWLSFASKEGYLGAVLVDGAPSFDVAVAAATVMGVNPGGECLGQAIDSDDVPADYRAAFAALPRWRLLSKEDLRVLGPLENLDGEPR